MNPEETQESIAKLFDTIAKLTSHVIRHEAELMQHSLQVRAVIRAVLIHIGESSKTPKDDLEKIVKNAQEAYQKSLEKLEDKSSEIAAAVSDCPSILSLFDEWT